MKGKIVCIQTLARNVMESYWLRRLKWFIPRKVGVKWRNFVSAISILNEVIKNLTVVISNSTGSFISNIVDLIPNNWVLLAVLLSHLL